MKSAQRHRPHCQPHLRRSLIGSGVQFVLTRCGALTEGRYLVKALLVISNGRGIIAEGDDMQALHTAYDASITSHKDDAHTAEPKRVRPAFDTLRECHEEGVTGAACILKTEELPHAAKEYYLAGFVA